MQRLFEQTWELELAERPQHVQRAALDRRARAVPRPQRRPPCRCWGAARLELSCHAARHPADSGVPGLERLGAQRQADLAPSDLLPFGILGAVVLARLLGRRDGVRAAPLQHVRHPLRRDRRGLRDDLGALLRDGRARRIGRSRPRGPRRARPYPPGERPPRTRSAANGTRSPPRRGRAGRRCGQQIQERRRRRNKD